MLQPRRMAELACMAIFVLGVAAGALAVIAYQRWSQPAPPAGWARVFDRERYVKELREAVGLRPDQMEALNRILDETREEFLALRRRLRPQFDEVRQRARERIRELLAPEQRARFEAFLKRWDEERRRAEEATSAATTSGR
jgi:hypothetical protein